MQLGNTFSALGTVVDTMWSATMEIWMKNKWIKQVSAYGMTAPYQCAAELYVAVDWDGAYRNILAAEERIIFSARREWMTLDVYSFAYTFTEYVSRNNLSVILDAEYVQGIDYETANRRLGLPNIGTLRWVGRQPPTNVLRIPGLDEVTVGIRLT